MISLTKGDIFASECEYLVNPVNTQGVMGKGLALAFKEKYPDMFSYYKQKCDKGHIKVGIVHEHSKVFLFPTKQRWMDKSRIEWVAMGLSELANKIYDLDVTSIAIPALGCGEGGLRWKDVRELFETWADSYAYLLKTCEVKIYAPV